MKNFIIKEFVPPEIWEVESEKSLNHIDARILESIEQIRTHFGSPVIINNWCYGGQFKYRGYRPAECTIGAAKSLHRSGRALDFDVVGLAAQDVRAEILKNEKKFPHIKRMETGVNWVHIDLRGTGQERIMLFNP